jgi:hypothetical protein
LDSFIVSSLDINRNWDGSVGIAVSYGLDGQDSIPDRGKFLYYTASRSALGPTRPPVQWVPSVLFPGVKWLGHEADHSPPSSAEVICRNDIVLNCLI